MDAELRTNLVELLRESGRAHRAAFEAENGEDPDWPIWYADYLQDPLARQIGMKFQKSRLIYCLMNADFEHKARAPDSDWPEYYADLILERCAPSDSPAQDKLALYYFDGCPFCSMVKSGIEDLGVDVELRNIFQNPEYRDELVAARGRATVPVLRITSPNGEERWMPESREILRYLEKSVADAI